MSKRAVLSAIIFIAVMTILPAVSLEEIVDSATEASPTYNNILLSYHNGLMDLMKLDEESGTVVLLSGSVNPLQTSNGPLQGKDGEYGIMLSPSATVTLPNGKTRITGSIGYGVDYKNQINLVTPSVGASHSFDFSGYDSSYAEDLEYTRLHLTTERAFANSEISFKKNVVSMISQLLTAEKNLENSRESLRKLEKSFEDINALGTLSKDSASYKNQANTLQSARDSLDAMEEQYEITKETYKNLTGLEWEGVDPISEPVLELNILEKGNTSVYLKSLAVDLAQDSYDKSVASLNPSQLSVSGSASGSYVNFTDTALKDTGSLKLSGSVGYTASNWKVSASPSFDWTFSDETKFTPGLTISGSWTNGTLAANGATAKSDSNLTLGKLQNNLAAAQNDYYSSLSDYYEEGQSLALDIMQWNFKKAQALSNMEYLETNLNTQKELFSLGLVVEDKVKDAELALSQAQYSWDILMLEGHNIAYDLEIYAL